MCGRLSGGSLSLSPSLSSFSRRATGGAALVSPEVVFLDDARQLNVAQGEAHLRVEGVLGLVGVRADLQLEGLRPGDDGVRLEQFGSTESVLALADAVHTALVDADEVVRVAHAARRSAQLGHVGGCGRSGGGFDRADLG